MGPGWASAYPRALKALTALRFRTSIVSPSKAILFDQLAWLASSCEPLEGCHSRESRYSQYRVHPYAICGSNPRILAPYEIYMLSSLGRQLQYFVAGEGAIVDAEIVKGAVTVVIVAVATAQEQGVSRLDPF